MEYSMESHREVQTLWFRFKKSSHRGLSILVLCSALAGIYIKLFFIALNWTLYQFDFYCVLFVLQSLMWEDPYNIKVLVSYINFTMQMVLASASSLSWRNIAVQFPFASSTAALSSQMLWA